MCQLLWESVAALCGRKDNEPMTKKQRRRTPEQIIGRLAEGHKLMAGGMTIEEVCREFGIAESSWPRWLSQYGGMKADDAKRLKELKVQNARSRGSLWIRRSTLTC